MALPKVVKDFNLFIDGRGYAGRVEEVQLPKIEEESEDYKAGGMLGSVKIPMGLKGLEMEFTLAEFSVDVLDQWGVADIGGIGARFLAAAVAGDGTGTDAIEISVRGKWDSLDLGTVKKKDLSKMKVKMPLTYYKYSVNGITHIEADMLAEKLVVNGIDRTAELRTALSL